MNYHIVRMNETIEKIALTYNLSVEEIKNNNRHIRNWDNIIAGTRINLPAIPEIVKDNLNDFEPFIEDYYPRYNEVEEIKDNEIINQESNDVKVESNNIIDKPSTNNKPIKKPIFYNGYYPPYQMYYPYYPYFNNVRIRKK